MRIVSKQWNLLLPLPLGLTPHVFFLQSHRVEKDNGDLHADVPRPPRQGVQYVSGDPDRLCRGPPLRPA